MKTVSVVMCTYNGEKYLSEQLDSLIAQTYPLKEILVQDDGSTDNTADIVRRYQEKYPYIALTVNSAHQGINDNFFSAMRRATGDYIAISDQDDIWEPDKIALQMEAIGDKLLCSGLTKPFSSDGSPISFDPRVPNYSLIRAMYIGSLPGHTLLLDRRLLHRLPDESPLTYDMQLQLAAAATRSIAFVNKVLVNQRRYITAATYARPTDNTLTARNIWRKMRETLRYYREVKPYMQQRFALIEAFIAQLPVQNALTAEALNMAHLQTQRSWLSYWRLTCSCVRNRRYLFHVPDSNRLRALLRAIYFPVFCSYYYRYASKNFRR